MENGSKAGQRQRVGLVGIGGIAQKVYLPLLSAHPGVELVGVVSRSEATVYQMIETYRLAQGSTQLDDIAGWDVDAVFVHSPTPTHYDIVTRCLQLGLPVYVDKPLSYHMEESRRMAAMAEERGLLLAVGFNRRFAPFYQKAKTWLAEAGGFDWCEAAKHRTGMQRSSARETVYDDLIHMLDLLLWLGGNDYELLSRQLRQHGNGAMLHASGMLSLGRERYASYSMARSAGTDLEKLSLHGSGRSAEVVNMESLCLYEKDQLPQYESFGSWDTILQRRGFAGVVDHFLNHLQTPEECSIRADRVLSTHLLAEQLTAEL
ncbi:Gfo/Idh/MocA family protein [Paenibacillus wulumuqiensis]|uniref:Gfo/Idh/MocA family protein n=1 Tax=Paenibacillus wulumuqiensis TaxID=1567107 RepID=UPI0006190715|nr:Gfo/Idh/MocA family oxidoreductase [Paenibacillus wulumuqiensis]